MRRANPETSPRWGPNSRADCRLSQQSLQFLVHGPAEAEPLFAKAVAIAESGLGREHPLFGQILFSCADLLERMNREAEENRGGLDGRHRGDLLRRQSVLKHGLKPSGTRPRACACGARRPGGPRYWFMFQMSTCHFQAPSSCFQWTTYLTVADWPDFMVRSARPISTTVSPA